MFLSRSRQIPAGSLLPSVVQCVFPDAAETMLMDSYSSGRYQRKQPVFSAGDPGSSMFFVNEGSVSVIVDDHVVDSMRV
jgi:CRP-like cAMP-binding protein